MADCTQCRHPWRATMRTVLAELAAIMPLLPVLAREAGIATVPVVAALLTITAAATRVLADPRVEDYLRRRFPSVAASPEDENATHNNH